MNLAETIDTHLKEAIKSGDSVKAGTLKMLKSDIAYEKAKKGDDLNDEKIIEVIARAAKRRKESMEEFTKANRQDLADQEAAELAVIEEYLPEQLSRDDIAALIDNRIAEMGDVTQK